MADNASKAVEKALFDTWSRGASLLGLITDKGPVARGGDSYDLPFRSAFTVNSSETAAAAATSLSAVPVSVNIPMFINQTMTRAQQQQLLGGDGAFAKEVARSAGGDFQNALERNIIEYLISTIAGAGGVSAALHANVGGDAVTASDVNDLEAAVREQDGIVSANSGLFWLASPRAAGNVKSISGYGAQVQSTPEQMAIGLPMGGMLNGMPIYLHNGVPGAVNRYSATCSSSNIATNVCTATFSAGNHGFVAGQQIYTTGFTAGNIPVATPVAITSTTATTVVFPQTASNGSNGLGTIVSASAMMLLCYGPWITYATDAMVPGVKILGREGAAGDVLQLAQYLGRGALAGACGILHAPDGV